MLHVIYPVFQGKYNKSTFYDIQHYQEALERLQGHPGGVQHCTIQSYTYVSLAVHPQDVLEGVLEPTGNVECK